MKVTRILAVVLLLGLVAGAASAQEDTRLSWNSCLAWNSDVSLTPVATKLVYSVINASGPYNGHDTNLTIGPTAPLPDCWRFDVGGCNDGLATISFAKSTGCFAALQGSAPLAITNWGYDLLTGKMIVRIANTFNADGSAIAVATNRYTLWSITFDFSASQNGPSGGGFCGGLDSPENLVADTQFLHADGSRSFNHDSPQRYVTTSGGVLPVAAKNTTWSKVKGLYH